MESNNKVYLTENAPEESTFDYRKLISRCLRNWYWFVLSVLLCCGVAVYKILSTKPEYSRTAILLIKESNIRRSSSSEVEAMLAQAGQMPSKLANEIVVLQAPAHMSEAVDRLGLTVDYELEGSLRNIVLYGSSVPVTVDFSDIPDEMNVRLSYSNMQDSILVKDIVYRYKGEKYKDYQTYTAVFGKVIELPFGKVVFNKNPYFYSDKEWEKSVTVNKRSLASATNRYMNRFTVESQESRTRVSDVLTLNMVDYSKNRADDLLNMIITIYNEKWVIENNKMAAGNSDFIEDRLKTIESELNKVDNTITNYKTKNKLPNLEEASKLYTTQASEIARQIRDLESQLSVAKYLKSFLSSVDDNTLIPLPSGINSVSITNQVNEYNKMLLNRNSMLSVSSEKNPMVIDLAESLNAMRGAIISSVDNQVAALEKQISSAVHQQTITEDRIAQSPTQALDLVKYERLQKVQENLYVYLLQKREENELSQAFSAYNTRVVNPPYGSPVPINPQPTNIILIALIIGICLPIGVIVLRIYFDNVVRSKKDLEKVKLPFIGEIPHFYAQGETYVKHKLLNRKQKNAPLSALVVEVGNRNIINEAFRITRANLEFVCKSSNDKVIMFTSMSPGSGKTFVNVNLATALAINDKKVLLIDCDFRKRTLSQFLNVNKKGFADYLSNLEGQISDYIVKSVNQKTLDVLPVGTLPPNPSELLAKHEVAEAIEQLKSEYDFIFLDCPPMEIVADTQIVAPLADRTLFIVRAGIFDKRMAPALNTIEQNTCYKNLAIILNDTKEYGGGSYGSTSYNSKSYYSSKKAYYIK